MAFLRTSEGHEAPLSTGETIMGSAPEADLQIRSEFGLADRHLIIEHSVSGWSIAPIDLEYVSTVNGSPLQEKRPLKDGAYIKASQFEFRFLDSASVMKSEPPVAESSHPVELDALPAIDDFPNAPPVLPLGPAKALAASQGKEHRSKWKALTAALLLVTVVAAILVGVIAAASKANAETLLP